MAEDAERKMAETVLEEELRTLLRRATATRRDERAAHAKHLKELEKENSRLRRAVSDLTLDKQILKEKQLGNY